MPSKANPDKSLPSLCKQNCFSLLRHRTGEMATRGIQLDHDKLSCPVCLDLLRRPVTIPCGHSYCMSCIKSCWSEEDQMESHSCPQCRQSFMPRPVLVKNTVLADLVEELKKTHETEPQAAPHDSCYARRGDVACDFCTGTKRKATKTCLQCQVSSCELHLQPHYEVAPLKKHKLVETSSNVQENICSRHNEVMKIFCRTDGRCICYLCLMDEHKGHDTVSADAEISERKKEFGACWQKLQQRIQDRETSLKIVQQQVEDINRSADKAVKSSEKVFNELLRAVRKRSSDTKQHIKSRQRAEVKSVKELQEKLQQEIAELKRKDAELEQLSLREDNISLFHNHSWLSALAEFTDSPSVNVCARNYFEDVTAAVTAVRDKLQDAISKGWTEISLMESDLDVFHAQAEPKSRAEFCRYSQQITLDLNTANSDVSLSEGNRKATNMEVCQLHPRHPDRFTDVCQVLSKDSLSTRCYWEVEWSGGGVSVAVTYKNINRGGGDSGFGNNDRSWALECSQSGNYHFKHANIRSSTSGPQASKVGVYLDHRAGTLSFYSVSESMSLLHRVQTTFTQPLYAGLCVDYFGSTAEVCELK